MIKLLLIGSMACSEWKAPMDSERSYFLDRSAETLARTTTAHSSIRANPWNDLFLQTVDFISSFLAGTSFQPACRVVAKPTG